jgi:hypothetical protein
MLVINEGLFDCIQIIYAVKGAEFLVRSTHWRFVFRTSRLTSGGNYFGRCIDLSYSDTFSVLHVP